MPEWKTKALGKAPTFGFNDARPIKEQRESLPIFKLRDQLIEAVNTNQARPAPFTSSSTKSSHFYMHGALWSSVNRQHV